MATTKKKTITTKKTTPKKAKTGKNSNEPWVELIGSYENSDGSIRVELDWNDAFINQLKLKGFTGANDDQIMQKYVIVLYKQIAESLREDGSEYE